MSKIRNRDIPAPCLIALLGDYCLATYLLQHWIAPDLRICIVVLSTPVPGKRVQDDAISARGKRPRGVPDVVSLLGEESHDWNENSLLSIPVPISLRSKSIEKSCNLTLQNVKLDRGQAERYLLRKRDITQQRKGSNNLPPINSIQAISG